MVRGAPTPLQIRTLTGLENVLADELRALGAQDLKVGNRHVNCVGDRQFLYEVNLKSRTAIRVLRPLFSFESRHEQQFYDGIRGFDWRSWMLPTGTLAVDAHVYSSFTTHSLYVAQLAKDAIVDRFRDMTGNRPSVDLQA